MSDFKDAVTGVEDRVADAAHSASREYALARLLNGLLIQIGGENLQGDILGRFVQILCFQSLFEEDRQGIGFLAGGAGGEPCTQCLIRSAASQ